jgi:hypothetical protein
MFVTKLPKDCIMITADGKVMTLVAGEQKILLDILLQMHPEWAPTSDEHARYCTNEIERGHSMAHQR